LLTPPFLLLLERGIAAFGAVRLFFHTRLRQVLDACLSFFASLD
jgi:hypothetical protein